MFGIMARGDFVIGPMWFAYALLVFSLAYVVWRKLVPVKPASRKPVPEQRRWVMAAFGVGAAALIIRQFVPVGEEVLDLQLGYFASYVFLFALGCIAERYGWLAEVKRKHALPWMIAAAVALPLLPIALVVGEQIGQTNFATGFSFPAIFYAFWEPVVAWGIIQACCGSSIAGSTNRTSAGAAGTADIRCLHRPSPCHRDDRDPA